MQNNRANKSSTRHGESHINQQQRQNMHSQRDSRGARPWGEYSHEEDYSPQVSRYGRGGQSVNEYRNEDEGKDVRSASEQNRDRYGSQPESDNEEDFDSNDTHQRQERQSNPSRPDNRLPRSTGRWSR